MKVKLVLLFLATLIAAQTWAESVSVPYIFSNGTTASASEVNSNFKAIENAVNDNDTNIKTNTTNIQTNANTISTNTTSIENNAINIGNNTTNIQTNANTISTNTASIENNATKIDKLSISIEPHSLVKGKNVRSVDINPTFIAIAFSGQLDGIDIPYQSGITRLNCSPECPEAGVLFPGIRLINPDKSFRELQIPTLDIQELIDTSITERISKPGIEQLLFSSGHILEIIAPRSDPRILMYVQDQSLGGEVSVLWDVWPSP